MSLSIRKKIRLRAKSVEFQLPLYVEKIALRMTPGLNTSPWLCGEKKWGVIFTHIPKSAGTSVVNSLFSSKSRHIPILRYAAYDEKLFLESFKFTFVRNPFSRIHSAFHYLHRVVGKGDDFLDWTWASYYFSNIASFEEFVLRLRDPHFRCRIKEYIHFRDQIDWISIPRKGLVMDFIGRFESLEEDFQLICERLGRECSSLPELRPGNGQDYRRSFTPEMVDIVSEVYRKDINAFEYGFNG